MEKEPSVSIIIVTWNNENEISDCLNSIKQIDYTNFKVIVVDNKSSDETVRIIKENFPDTDVIENIKNSYFTGGNNIGFDYALDKHHPDYILILNPDTIVEKNLLQALIKVSQQDKKIGAVGPKIIFEGGENHGKINSASLFYDNFHSAYDNGFGEEDKGQFDHTKEVFAVTGTCILFKSQFIKQSGGFWEVLKMYTDEIELFLRGKKLGWKVYYTGSTAVKHKYMKSTTQEHSTNYDKLKMRNWLIIALRHYSMRDKLRMIRDYLKFIF